MKKEESLHRVYGMKLKNLFFHPFFFFNSVEKEDDQASILFSYFTLSVIIIMISSILSINYVMAASKEVPEAYPFGPGIYLIVTFFFGILFSFIVPFILGGITHLGVLIVGGSKGFFNTFKPVTYTAMIGLVYGLLSSIVSFIFNLISPFDPSLLSNPLEMFSRSDIAIRVSLSMMIFFVSLSHQLVTGTIGLSKFQKMSQTRAFLSMIIIPLLLIVIALILLGMVLFSLLG